MSYISLIVDESITTRALIKRAIRQAGPPMGRIHEATDGKEALEFLDSHRVDLVLADLDSSEPAELEDIIRILSEPATRSIPVIILAAAPDARQLNRLRRAGARCCLRKPFTAEDLRHAISRTLEPTHV